MDTDVQNSQQQVEVVEAEQVSTELAVEPLQVPVPAKHAGGRPRILQSVEQAEQLIEEYFQLNDERPTMCGLAMHLGFVDRCSLLDYIARNDEFSAPMKKALTFIEMKHEQRLTEGQVAGSIFWLKNRGWRDTHDVTSDGEKLAPQIVAFGALPRPALGGNSEDSQ